MMEEKILNLLLQQLGERKEMLAEAMYKGAPKDYAEYQYIVGQIRGLEAGQLLANDLLRKLKENNDD